MGRHTSGRSYLPGLCSVNGGEHYQMHGSDVSVACNVTAEGGLEGHFTTASRAKGTGIPNVFEECKA